MLMVVYDYNCIHVFVWPPVDAILDLLRDWPAHMEQNNEIWRTSIPVGEMVQRLVLKYHTFRTNALGDVKATVKLTDATKFTVDQKLKARFRSRDGMLFIHVYKLEGIAPAY